MQCSLVAFVGDVSLGFVFEGGYITNRSPHQVCVFLAPFFEKSSALLKNLFHTGARGHGMLEGTGARMARMARNLSDSNRKNQTKKDKYNRIISKSLLKKFTVFFALGLQGMPQQFENI